MSDAAAEPTPQTLEEALAENARLRAIVDNSGAVGVVGGEPGISLLAEAEEAVARAEMKVVAQRDQLDGALASLEEARAQLAAVPTEE